MTNLRNEDLKKILANRENNISLTDNITTTNTVDKKKKKIKVHVRSNAVPTKEGEKNKVSLNDDNSVITNVNMDGQKQADVHFHKSPFLANERDEENNISPTDDDSAINTVDENNQEQTDVHFYRSPILTNEKTSGSFYRGNLKEEQLTKDENEDVGEYIIPEHNKDSHHRHHHHHHHHHNSSKKHSSGKRNNDYEDFIYVSPRRDLDNKTHKPTLLKHSKSHRHKSKGGNSAGKKRHGMRNFFLVLLSIAVCIVGLFFMMKNIGRSALLKSEGTLTAPKFEDKSVVLEDDGYTVKYKGHTYKYNENVTNILFMGIDKTSLGVIDNVVGTGGQADALYLAAVDFDSGKITTFGIPREVMADIGVYSSSGKYLGIQKKQICLAYAYGDGKVASCKNLISAVEKLFFGVNINSFVAMDLMAIQALNDSIGGVEVVLDCDMMLNDTFYKAGETVHLLGNAAETFVRSRDMEELEANLDRMNRQKIYLNAFISKVAENTKRDIKTPIEIYNTADDYMITDIDAAKLTYFVTEFMKNGISAPNIQSVPGETVMGEEYAEYYVDQEKFYELFLDAYYVIVD